MAGRTVYRRVTDESGNVRVERTEVPEISQDKALGALEPAQSHSTSGTIDYRPAITPRPTVQDQFGHLVQVAVEQNRPEIAADLLRQAADHFRTNKANQRLVRVSLEAPAHALSPVSSPGGRNRHGRA
jgi:hypothetical protein